MSDINEAIRRLTATVAASDAFEQDWRMRPTAYPGHSVSQDFIEDIRAVLAERTWQPIETAPKDGTRLLLYGFPDGAFTGEWEFDSWRMEPGFEAVDRDRWPTHWMPLPEAPR